MKSKNIPLDELEEGPIRHAELPPALVARINEICLALQDVYPSSPEDWLKDFQRDLHPEREVAWWERLARSYVVYTSNRDLSGGQRKAAFNILLNISLEGNPETRSNSLAALPEGALAELRAILRKQGL